MTATPPDFDLWAGSDKTLRFPLVDEDGDLVDASGATAAVFSLIHSAGTLIKTLGAGIDVSSGDPVVTLVAADTAAFGQQTGAYQMEVKIGGEDETVQDGKVNIFKLTIPP